jgi:hypothetical protein
MASRTGWTGRALIGAVAVMVLIALAAVPSFGASKKYTLDVKPNATTAGISTDFTLAFANTTPGNSAVNSLSVNVPFALQSGTVVTASILPKPDSTNANATATVNVVGSQVRVQSIDSLKTNQVIKIKITATFGDPSPGNCTHPSALWAATVYAGNSLTGDTFANQGTDPQRSLTLNSASCIHLQFVDGRTPQDAIQGKTITNTDLNTPAGASVQVELVAGTTRIDVDTSGKPVTLSPTPGVPAGGLAGNTADFVDGLATFPELKISNVGSTQVGGDYTLTPSYLSYPATASPSFRIFDALICGAASGQAANYIEDSQATTDGQITINTTNDECFGVIVDNAPGAPGSGNIEDWSVTKSSAGLLMQGTLDFVWDLPGTTPVKWTQVTWGVVGTPSFVDYHDVQLCNPGVAVDNYANLFPTIPNSPYGPEQMCLFSSALVNTASGWTQLETIAYNTDYGGRK